MIVAGLLDPPSVIYDYITMVFCSFFHSFLYYFNKYLSNTYVSNTVTVTRDKVIDKTQFLCSGNSQSLKRQPSKQANSTQYTECYDKHKHKMLREQTAGEKRELLGKGKVENEPSGTGSRGAGELRVMGGRRAF